MTADGGVTESVLVLVVEGGGGSYGISFCMEQLERGGQGLSGWCGVTSASGGTHK